MAAAPQALATIGAMSLPVARAPLPVWRHPEFARGVREMVGTAIGIGAWGLITGVAMGRSGLPLGLMLLMSLLVFSGSAQLAVLPLMSAGAPAWVIWATALCVNLRFVIFSAQWRAYFMAYPLRQRLWLAHFTADLNYVLFMRRFPKPEPSPEQLPYFWGGAATNWVAWQVPSIAGLFLADVVPVQWGIGFAGTLVLLALVCSLLVDGATVVSGAVAGCAAVAAYALPFKLDILVAIAAAVSIGLLVDHTTPRAALPVDDRT